MQTLTDFELIVVDDCSTDESGEILEYYRAQDERVRLFSTARNGGPGAARNIGLKHSRGSYIAFLDADDFWIKDKLERQVRLFERDEVILSYTSVILLDAQGSIVGIINGRNKVHLVDMFIGNRVTMSSAMIRRDLSGAREMPGMRNREDHAFWISLLKTKLADISREFLKLSADTSRCRARHLPTHCATSSTRTECTFRWSKSIHFWPWGCCSHSPFPSSRRRFLPD